MRPKTGGRVELDLVAAAVPIVYRATLFFPEAEHRGEATIDGAGAVSFGVWTPPDPPSWLVDYARNFLRGEWRGRQGPDPAPWPQRISRWRTG